METKKLSPKDAALLRKHPGANPDELLSLGLSKKGYEKLNVAAETKERGLTLYKNNRIKGQLRKLKIHAVKVYPLLDKEQAILKIYDDYAGGTVSTYHIDLKANEVNTFNIAGYLNKRVRAIREQCRYYKCQRGKYVIRQ